MTFSHGQQSTSDAARLCEELEQARATMSAEALSIGQEKKRLLQRYQQRWGLEYRHDGRYGLLGSGTRTSRVTNDGHREAGCNFHRGSWRVRVDVENVPPDQLNRRSSPHLDQAWPSTRNHVVPVQTSPHAVHPGCDHSGELRFPSLQDTVGSTSSTRLCNPTFYRPPHSFVYSFSDVHSDIRVTFLNFSRLSSALQQ